MFLLYCWRLWLLLCYTKSGIINSALFTLLVWSSDGCSSNEPLRGLFDRTRCVCYGLSFCLSLPLWENVWACCSVILKFNMSSEAAVGAFSFSHYTITITQWHQKRAVYLQTVCTLWLVKKEVFYTYELRHVKWHVNSVSELTKEVICHHTPLGTRRGNSLWKHPVLNFTANNKREAVSARWNFTISQKPPSISYIKHFFLFYNYGVRCVNGE